MTWRRSEFRLSRCHHVFSVFLAFIMKFFSSSKLKQDELACDKNKKKICLKILAERNWFDGADDRHVSARSEFIKNSQRVLKKCILNELGQVNVT